MPRGPRIDIPGLIHHVICRGIEQREIFADALDYEHFLSRTSYLAREDNIAIYAFALMPNHLHLLVRPLTTSLATFMRRLLTGYAIYFNRRHKRSGHLFQNRYKSFVIEEDAYFLESIRYIHLNPLRAGIVKDLEALCVWPYTGHAALMGKTKASFLKTDDVLGRFAKTRLAARRKLNGFMQEGVFMGRQDDPLGDELPRDDLFGDDPLGGNPLSDKLPKDKLPKDKLPRGAPLEDDPLGDELPRDDLFGDDPLGSNSLGDDLFGGGLKRSMAKHSHLLDSHLLGRGEQVAYDERILGSSKFVESLLDELHELHAKSHSDNHSITLGDIIQSVASHYGITFQELCSGARREIIVKARTSAIWCATKHLTIQASTLAKTLNVSATAVCRILKSGRGEKEAEAILLDGDKFNK